MTGRKEPHERSTGRRGPHQGSIYRRSSDGRWTGSVQVGYEDGKRVRRTVYGGNPSRGQGKGDGAPSRSRAGSSNRRFRSDLGGLSRRVVEVNRDHGPPTDDGVLRRDCPRSHQADARPTPSCGSAARKRASASRRRGGAGLSPRTVQYIHAVLRLALAQAERWGLIPKNVARLVTPPRVRRPEVAVLSPDEVRVFLAHIHGDRLEALVTVAVALGLRQGEAFALRWVDVDLTAGTLFVRHSLQRIRGVAELVEPKTARSRRAIAMPEIVANALRAHHR